MQKRSLTDLYYAPKSHGELPTTEAVGFLLYRNKLAYPPALDKWRQFLHTGPFQAHSQNVACHI